ncbi:MAG: hypothetical protein R3E02_05365 [Blastomonas sp.]
MLRMLIALFLLALPLEAVAADSIALTSKVYVERSGNGKSAGSHIVLEEPDTVKPGDKLIYIVEYRNQGTDEVSDFIVTNPLPRTVRFDRTVRGDEIVSVDNGRSWGRLDGLRVTLPQGGTRAAQPSDVTHLRWRMPRKLAAGESGKVTFRAIVR